MEETAIRKGYSVQWNVYPSCWEDDKLCVQLYLLDPEDLILFDEGGDDRKLLLCHAVLAIGEPDV